MKKTNAMRILDSLGIPYQVLSYDDDGEHKLELGAAELVARKLGVPPDSCLKTIVMRNESREVFVLCQSAHRRINLKKARTACKSKELASVKPEELLPLTGYIRGGCSPLGMRRKYPTFIDQAAMEQETVCISAGIRGQQLRLTPQNLLKATQATIVDLALEEKSACVPPDFSLPRHDGSFSPSG